MHTKWKLDEDRALPLAIVEDTVLCVCVFELGRHTPERVANAKRIVRAVNCHDELAGAIDDLVSGLESIGFGDDDADVSGADCVDVVARALPRLREALAKALGGACGLDPAQPPADSVRRAA